MTEDTHGRPNCHALLIGVDHYLPHRLPGGSYYPKLSGCVQDIERVEEFLRTKLHLADAHILTLTATYSTADEPPEPQAQWPTYENMVAAFKRVTELAHSGDQVYIHYSGHGGRTKTIYPELKGKDAYDESLVPMDIGRPTARYLRDIELAHLFQQMVDKGLIVTVVLDSCHSGGTTRSVDVTVRGIAEVDETRRVTDSLVASAQELAATWQRATGGQTRGLKAGGGWLPQPEGYVLLAACQPQELAHEYEVEPGRRGGALTYWTIDSLKQIRPGFTYKMLLNRVLPKVHSKFPQQTPQLQGAGSRAVFGSELVPPVQAVNVMQVDKAGGRVLLSTGQAQAVRPGAQFAVYSAGTTDLIQPDKRLALVEVDELGATTSWAKIAKRFGDAPIEPAAQAVLLEPGSVRLRRRVRLVGQGPEAVPETVEQDSALAAVQAVLETDGLGWVELGGEGETVDYQVAVSAAGEYEIWDRSGQPIPGLRPPLKIGAPGAAAGIVRRLVHLTKYNNLLLLDNHDRSSPLTGALEVEVLRAQADFAPGDRPEPQPFDDPGHTPTAIVGDWLMVRIENQSSQVINVAVLDLQPNWGISQVHPTWTEYITLDPGAKELFPLQAGLPEGYTEGTDILKVFATLEGADFRWLELPELDQPPTRKAVITRAAREGNPLEQLLAAFTDDRPKTRQLNPMEYPSRGWATEQVEVRIRKKPAGSSRTDANS